MELNEEIAALEKLNASLSDENIKEDIDLIKNIIEQKRIGYMEMFENKKQMEAMLKSLEAKGKLYEESASVNPGSEIKQERFKLERERQLLIKSIKNKKEKLEYQRNKLENTQNEFEKLQSKQMETSGKNNIKIPGLKHRLNLFKHIANIEWDTSQNNKIQGFIQQQTKLEQFSYDTNQLSPFEISDGIWDLLEKAALN